MFKKSLKMEDYPESWTHIETNFTKLRISAHKLEIEMGHYS